MATTKAKTKAAPSSPMPPAKAPRAADKSGTTARAGNPLGGLRAGPGISPADLPLPTGYVPKVELPKGYRPRADEDYMSVEHLEYFRRKLLIWRAELLEESQQTIENLRAAESGAAPGSEGAAQ